MGFVHFLEDGQFCVPEGVTKVRVTLVGAGAGHRDGSYSHVPIPGGYGGSGTNVYLLLEWD